MYNNNQPPGAPNQFRQTNTPFLNPNTGAPANPGYGAPPGTNAGFGGPPMGAPPMGAPPMGGPPMGGPPMGGPPMGGPQMGGPPMGGPPMGGPPMSGPPMGGPPMSNPQTNMPPPSGYTGAPMGSPQPGMPAPKPSVTFFSTSGGSVSPAPISNQAPPLSGTLPPPPGPNSVPPGPTTGYPSYTAPPGPGYPQTNINAHANHPLAPTVQGMGPNSQQAGVATSSGTILPNLDEIDTSIQCNPAFLRSSVTKLVSSQSLANASRIPLGIVCKPMAGDVGTENAEIDVVDFGSTGIIRCKRCRTYINPYITWTDNGRRWRCNICGMLNDIPSSYFSHLDANGQRRDKAQRPELCKASVEFVAPGDYMVRPPQPPVYFFLIDVSEISINSGMIYSTVNAIKKSLSSIPGKPRTQVGFITFDSTIHFYNLKSSLSTPQVIIISDINDLILPLPEDLLVNLQDSYKVVENLLDSLPTMFKPQGNAMNAGSFNPPSCTGAALQAAKRVVQHLGGKICLFQSSIPSLGEGALKMRENPSILGTDKEHTLLHNEDPYYKSNAIDLSRIQTTVDTFLFGGNYMDVATISLLSKITGGNCFYYPNFYYERDGEKFENELYRVLTRAIAFEAVMRIRATKGMRFSNYYGNYFIRGTDLLALPNCTSDSTFALDMVYDEAQLSCQVITVQAALLYTNSDGERRIRVHTMILPVVQNVLSMVESADTDVMMNLLSKQAIEMSQKTGFENARQRIMTTAIEILRAAKQSGLSGYSSHHNIGNNMSLLQQLNQTITPPNSIPESLALLPLCCMSLQKSLILRGSNDIRIDERAFYHHLVSNMDVESLKVFLYPRMFSMHDMTNDVGLPYTPLLNDQGEEIEVDDEIILSGENNIKLANIVNLSYERLNSDGIYLLENGVEMFLWIGRNVSSHLILSLFNISTADLFSATDIYKIKIQPDLSDYASRFQTIIDSLIYDRLVSGGRYMKLQIIREGEGYNEALFARYLVEDRANFNGAGLSYAEYHAHIVRSCG